MSDGCTEVQVDAETIFTYSATQELRNALEKAGRDFRSDVVTVPTVSVMQAIIDASFGDDIYDEGADASVNALQDELVELSGKEAPLWVLSGTMGIRFAFIIERMCNVGKQAPCQFSASVTTVHPKNGVHLTLDDVKKNIIADGNIHFPPTRVVALENTLSGTILPLKDAREISDFVRHYPVPSWQQPIAMHLDGARLFDAVAAEGVCLKEYCAFFDSISFCLAKGVGAPMGSVIVGSKAFIERAKWYRKMFGGGTRQPGMMAAAALAALNSSIPLLLSVHALAKDVGRKLEDMGYSFALPVQTNMVIIDLEAADIPPTSFVEYCKQENVIVFPSGRLVFHHQISTDGASRLLKALGSLINDKTAGKKLADHKVNGGYT